MIAVRAFYADIFKAFIHQELYRRRKDLQLSQEEMAAKHTNFLTRKKAAPTGITGDVTLYLL